eukprot:600003-Amphidinium_carterae.1
MAGRRACCSTWGTFSVRSPVRTPMNKGKNALHARVLQILKGWFLHCACLPRQTLSQASSYESEDKRDKPQAQPQCIAVFGYSNGKRTSI